MTTIHECMSKNPKWIDPETTLLKAAQLMADRDCGFLPVGEGDRLVGMVTDRDIVVRGIANNCDPQLMMVRDVMSPQTYYCYEDQTVEEVCKNMAELQIRRMPVVNRDKRLVGIISFGDLAQRTKESLVGQSEQQITKPSPHARAA